MTAISSNISPHLSDNIFIHSAKGRILYLNPEIPDWISIKKKYKNIFDLFDGNNSFERIINFVKYNYSENDTELLIGQLKNLINYSKIFEHNQSLEKQNNNTYKFEPRYIYLTLTDDCNLNCRYCYAKERTKTEDSTLSQWIEYIDRIASISKNLCFNFTGGEPLLSAFLFDLAKYIHKKGFESVLLSNGVGIVDRKIANNIAEYFSLVKISLDSLVNRTNTYLRGKGVLQKVLKAVNLLDEADANLTIVATITQRNKNKIDDFSSHFKDRVSFQPLFQMGAGREYGELTISGMEYYQALSQAKVFKRLPGYHQDIHKYRCNPYKRCAMAIEELSIAPNGDLYPCHMLHYPELRIGNLNSDSIENLYYESPLLDDLRSINVDTIQQCRSCVVRNFCGAGCRARVDFHKHGLKGDDLFCVFEKQSILDALLFSFG